MGRHEQSLWGIVVDTSNRLIWLVLAGSFLLGPAWAEVSPTLDNQLWQIRLLAESQIEQAQGKIAELKARQPKTASLEDRRRLLSVIISMALTADHRESARTLINELDELGAEFKDPWCKALVLNYRALILVDEGKLEAANKLVQEGLLLAKNVNANRLTRQLDSTAATIDSNLGNFNSALQYQLAALNLINTNDSHDLLDQIQAFDDIGKIYLNLKDPQSALKYFDQASALAESIHAKNKIAVLTLNRGVSLAAMEKYNEAIGAYLEARQLGTELTDRRIEAATVNNLADAYYETGNFAEGLRYARLTMELAKALDNEDYEAGALVNIGLSHMGLGEVGLGAREVAQGIARLRAEGAKTEVEQALGQLAHAHARAGQYREAFTTTTEQLGLTVELFKTDRDRVVAEMGAKYEASEREKQIAQLERKMAQQGAEIQRKSLQRIIAIGAVLIVMAIMGIILYLYRRVKQANRRLEEANQKLARQSNRDPLTGLFNRRAFLDFMHHRTATANRRTAQTDPTPHALVMLDIDHFKRINDLYGHAAGDAVLVELSQRLARAMRDQDMLMRWGGEEFLIFLSHVPESGLAQIVERTLLAIGGQPVQLETTTIATTVSIGYVALPLGTESEIDRNWEKILSIGDAALYLAKTQGRNRAVGIRPGTLDKLDMLRSDQIEQAAASGVVVLETTAGPVQSETTIGS